MVLNLILLFAAISALTWWLSGYDSQVTGENCAVDIKRRTLRCGITLLLMGLGVGAVCGGGRFGGFVFIALVVPLALTWSGCLSELCAGLFHRLIDSHDSREFDPKALDRELDRLAELSQQHRFGEAIQLCTKLKESAAGSGLGLDTTLFRLYDEMFAEGTAHSPPLAEAQTLYEEGQCLLAESRLSQLLKRDPGNLATCIMLMRLYARNLRNSSRAFALLRALEQQRAVPTGFGDYARQRIQEWFDPDAEQKQNPEGIESILVNRTPVIPPEEESDPADLSIDELLAAGHLGTAIERLETEIKEHPQDFDLRLQLAEAHGVYCCNLGRANDIVSRIQTDPAFSPEQVKRAQARLREWRARRPKG